MEPRLLTVGVIADRLGEPLHRVLHVLRTRSYLVPVARAGTLRLYREEVVTAIENELAEIDARKRRKPRIVTGGRT